MFYYAIHYLLISLQDTSGNAASQRIFVEVKKYFN